MIDTNRAYNLLTRSYDTTDRTTMYPADTLWTNDSTVMEAADYGLARCQLGGATTSDCATSGTVGSTSGVAAGADFSIASFTDSTTSFPSPRM